MVRYRHPLPAVLAAVLLAPFGCKRSDSSAPPPAPATATATAPAIPAEPVPRASADGRVVAIARRLPEDISGVWTGVVGQDLRQVTDLNPGLRSVAWGRQERLSWQARDGLEIQGLLILPTGAQRTDGSFPLITLVHGGLYGRFADALQVGWALWGQ